MEINFFNEDCSFQLDNLRKYQLWLTAIAFSEDKEIAELNYIFTSDEYLLDINRQYLDHDYYTDIISFPMMKDPISGDIFISIDRVKENASQLEVPFEKELQRVMAHGLLHFMGYDDHEKEDIKKMRQAEEKAMALFDRQ